MKVSFDFDDTLDRKVVQDYAASVIERGIEVWIVTSRLSDDQAPSPDWNIDLYNVTKHLGIPNDRVEFRCYDNKWPFFLNKDFIWHLDDDWIELNLINKHTKTAGISVFGQTNWRQKCEKLLK